MEHVKHVLLVCTYHFIFLSAAPNISMPDPVPIVEANKGDKLWCSATGTHPIYIALVNNSTILANGTDIVGITLSKKGSYICLATNKYGTDSRVITVSMGKR